MFSQQGHLSESVGACSLFSILKTNTNLRCRTTYPVTLKQLRLPLIDRIMLPPSILQRHLQYKAEFPRFSICHRGMKKVAYNYLAWSGRRNQLLAVLEVINFN